MAAAATNSSVDIAVINNRSILSMGVDAFFEIAMINRAIFSSMGPGVFFKWLGRGALCFGAVALVLIACAVVFEEVAEEISRRRRKAALARRKRQQGLRRRQRSRMMSSIRDAPYEQLRAARTAENPCVVCRTDYEVGETCSLLPRCTHMFHKECIAAWLRHHTTCPICNATVARPD